MALLHNATLIDTQQITLTPETHMLPLPNGSGTAMDLMVNFTLQTTPTNYTIAVFNGSDSLRFSVTSPTVGLLRRVTVLDRPTTWSVASFDLHSTETTMDVRVLVDRSITEWFIGAGRIAISRRVYPPPGHTSMSLSTTSETVATVHAYDMGCGWI